MTDTPVQDEPRSSLTPREALDTLVAVPLVPPGYPTACDLLNISERAIWTRARNGTLPTFKVGRRRMVSTNVLRRIIDGSDAA